MVLPPRKLTVDKDLKKIVLVERATQLLARKTVSLGLGVFFLVSVLAVTAAFYGDGEKGLFVIAAGIVGGYMALNIGANDVANNVGPAVGARALTMMGALVMAAACEAGGAIIAGGDVVETISKGIIAPAGVAGADVFIIAMLSALLSAALWINVGTWIGAPVSTTHAVVGGVLGAGIAAAGWNLVNWPTMGAIAASWVISPVLGGFIAAGFLYFIRQAILTREDKIEAARKWVPVLIAIMASTFAMYLVMKGLKYLIKVPWWGVMTVGVAMFAASFQWVRPRIARMSSGMENRGKAVAGLFTVPLVFSAALLSFAHGANDVANAVGPLAAIVAAASGAAVASKVAVPVWVLVVGAFGISVGLLLFGPKLIRTVGEKITKLDQIRAFCVALSAAITVIFASALGLPVSSTHIAVGGVFGVGFLREYYANRSTDRKKPKPLDEFPPEKREKKIQKAERRRLVRRSHLMTIIAAWVVTVPFSAALAAVLYITLRYLMA